MDEHTTYRRLTSMVMKSDTPAVEVVGADSSSIVARCPYCGGAHIHGETDAPLSHRRAHCATERDTDADRGYWLLRPLPTLLEVDGGFRWWVYPHGRGPRDLGFGGPTPPGGGLLAHVLEGEGGDASPRPDGEEGA